MLLGFYDSLDCSRRFYLSIHILFKTIFRAVRVEFRDWESFRNIRHIWGNLIQILFWGIVWWVDWCYRVDVDAGVLLWYRIRMESLLDIGCIAMLGLWQRFQMNFAAKRTVVSWLNRLNWLAFNSFTDPLYVLGLLDAGRFLMVHLDLISGHEVTGLLGFYRRQLHSFSGFKKATPLQVGSVRLITPQVLFEGDPRVLSHSSSSRACETTVGRLDVGVSACAIALIVKWSLGVDGWS
jgi:hypothetical protein